MTERADCEVREDLGGDVEGDKGAGARKKAPRPSRCGAFTRARLAECLPVILENLLDKAGDGSLPHLRLVLALVALDGNKAAAKRSRKDKNLETVFLERWAEDRAEGDRERSERDAARQDSEKAADREAG